jgi:hypothetical protein
MSAAGAVLAQGFQSLSGRFAASTPSDSRCVYSTECKLLPWWHGQAMACFVVVVDAEQMQLCATSPPYPMHAGSSALEFQVQVSSPS